MITRFAQLFERRLTSSARALVLLARRSERGPSWPLVAMLAWALAVPPSATAGPLFFYRFTPIADTQGGFPYRAVGGFPSINSSGRIAFRAVLSSGVEGIFTRLGTGGVNTLADTGVSDFFGFGITTSINSLNSVLFAGLKGIDPVVTVLLRGQGNSATPLVSSSNSLDDFCGQEMNIQGTAAFRARRADGSHVIRTQGAGQLTGVVRTIAEEGSEFSSLACGPSIDFDGNVAFMATRAGRRAIFTRAPNGTLTQVVGDDNLFAGFSGVALNRNGGLAFTASLQTGGVGLFRAKNNVITKIAGTNSPALGNPTGFAINDSGQVAFEMAAGANGSSVFRGPGGLFGRLIGTGSVLFGRTVAFAHIDRGGLNSTNQIAVWIIFTDGSEMIARGDPVNRLDPIVSTGAVQLTTALGRRVGVDAPIVAPQGRTTLSFDVTFLTADGELNVKVGDTGGRTISASQPGVRQHIVVPLDPGTGGREPGTNHLTSLAFTLSGKAGATAQLSSVMIPGLFADQMDAGALSRWHVNSSDGGDVAVVSTARLPVAVRISPSNPPTPSRVTVATLSSRDFDAGEDVDRGSLRVVGLSPRPAQDSARSGAPACEVRDVNGDKLNDLVCQLEADAVKPQQELRVEAMTRFGWGIAGAGVLRGAPSASAK